MMLLKRIHSPQDIKQLTETQLEQLAKEIRAFLIQSLSKTGGHLASNLGVVELTIALHYVFNSPKDQIVWDVGHQCYVHKILTGRRKDFKQLRQLNGMCGFPKRDESKHDIFETGHSSTSISAALGLAKARDLKGDKNQVIAVIGDGALTGGLAFEALNNAGRSGSHLIIVLNDNEMSISKNVGGIGRYLNKLRSSKDYLKIKEDVVDLLNKIPILGEPTEHLIKQTKEAVKRFIIEDTLFEQLGFTYLGPIDGNNLTEIIEILENAKVMHGPIFIHVKTKKGKGYDLAEEKPWIFHGISPFNIKTGQPKSASKGLTFSEAFGNHVLNLADSNPKVVAITAAMPEGTGLREFSKAYPRRFFDVGIAEEHAITFAAGMACADYRPIVAIYSSFLQRAYDQILHDVCLQNLHVIIGIDRAGLVGEDGMTHHGLYDMAFLGSMPNITILAPKMPEEMEAAIDYAFVHKGPIALRYPKGTTHIDIKYANPYKKLNFRTLIKGKEIALLAVGKMVEVALEVCKNLNQLGHQVAVIEAPCVKPIKENDIVNLIDTYRYIFTLEDGIIQGGFGEKVFARFMMLGASIKGKCFGHTSGLVPHGKIEELFKIEHLDVASITDEIAFIVGKES